MFAIEYIDPSVGTITMKYRIQDEINNVEQEKEIDLVDCEEMLPGGQYEG